MGKSLLLTALSLLLTYVGISETSSLISRSVTRSVKSTFYICPRDLVQRCFTSAQLLNRFCKPSVLNKQLIVDGACVRLSEKQCAHQITNGYE